ncbi:MAG TPA: glycosyltransferase family 39 protein, partial [Anaerolineaceae bacterium]|nr:glycosyltransferase family 39 protein [Anaerolineaceae bacterium]
MRHDRNHREALYDLGLILLICVGMFYRFSWMNWSEGANLHPDEYGLTNTLTRLALPDSLSEYFNTRLSPLSPYPTYDLAGNALHDGPDNRMRWGQWPMILIRAAAELTGNTGYNELRLMGRALSALLDCLTLLLTYLTGRRLYSHRVGLLGAALFALAVMPIQQAHFMTVDTYAVFFAALSIYAAARVAQRPPVIRQLSSSAPAGSGLYRVDWRAIGGYLFFGAGLGMTLASKINLLPLGGMLLVAASIGIAGLKLRSRVDLRKILFTAAVFLMAAVLAAVVTFRLAQPMSFRAASGDTNLWTLQLNPDWLESMKVAQQESSGVISSPPSEQWADRAVLIFPWMNMIVWGMGIPLGITCWGGFVWAAVRVYRRRPGWGAHLLPLIWCGGYFLFMATRWVKSIRYFLPIYPCLCLLAAWALVELFRRARGLPAGRNRRGNFIAAGLVTGLVVAGSFAWATAFTQAVYNQGHTRVRATEWILENIPAPITLTIAAQNGSDAVPVAVPDGLLLMQGTRYLQSFEATSSGQLTGVMLPHVRNSAGEVVALHVEILGDSAAQILGQTDILIEPSITERGGPARAVFHGVELTAGKTYYLSATTTSNLPLQIYQNVIANEDWDEGLPVLYRGADPFGPFYRGINMPVRWTDDDN